MSNKKYFILLFLIVSTILVLEIQCSLFVTKDSSFKLAVANPILSSDTTEGNRYKREASEGCHFVNVTLPPTRKVTLCVLPYHASTDDIASTNVSVEIFGRWSALRNLSLSDMDIKLARGRVLDQDQASSIFGFIKNERFYGRVDIGADAYYLEPLIRYSSLIPKFVKDLDKLNISKYDALVIEQLRTSRKVSTFKPEISRAQDLLQISATENAESKRSKNILPGRLCGLVLIADHTYVELDSNNVDDAITRMMVTVAEADAIFRNADFDDDGFPDNVGFVVEKIILFTSPASNHYQFKRLPMTGVNGKEFLFLMSTYGALEGVCIGIAFTARTFSEHAVGLSFTAMADRSPGKVQAGGMCERPTLDGLNFNCLVVSTIMDSGERLSQAANNMALAHELGHSFGSDHDTPECGDYLMSPTSRFGNVTTHYMFSQCSRNKMKDVLDFRAQCLHDSLKPYCGNGVVERGEDCDCGLLLSCHSLDPCCVPRGYPGASCRVNKPQAQCHPAQGMCCKIDCTYRDLTRDGLRCSDIEKKCPCKGKNECSCGLNGICTEDECYSQECKWLGLKECPCPALQGIKHCMSCCRLPNKDCVLVHEAAEAILKTNHSLQSYAFKMNSRAKKSELNLEQNLRFSKNHCLEESVEETTPNSTNCVDIRYLGWKIDGHCTAFGKLGVCNIKGGCHLNEVQRNTFPFVKSKSRSGSSSKTCSIFNHNVSIFHLLMLIVNFYCIN